MVYWQKTVKTYVKHHTLGCLTDFNSLFYNDFILE